jgi:hypothetical protein
VRPFFALVVGVAAVVLLLLFIGSLGQVSPGNPVIAVLLALGVMVVILAAFRSVARARGPRQEAEPEDVADLDVFFVCTECGTELRVEKIGELQVPRHCGEPMRVERRPAGTPRGWG